MSDWNVCTFSQFHLVADVICYMYVKTFNLHFDYSELNFACGTSSIERLYLKINSNSSSLQLLRTAYFVNMK